MLFQFKSFKTSKKKIVNDELTQNTITPNIKKK